MANFPSIAKPWAVKPKTLTNTIRSPFEAGYVQTRARNTRARKRFQVVWEDLLPTADRTTLETFFTATVHGGADAFNWTDPTTSATHVVRFVEDDLEFEQKGLGFWALTINLEEV
jgi:phage-related protein